MNSRATENSREVFLKFVCQSQDVTEVKHLLSVSFCSLIYCISVFIFINF